MAAVELQVNTQLAKIADELIKISKQAITTENDLKANADNISKGLEDQSKKTGDFLQRMGAIGRRVSSQLKDDFRALLSLNAISQSMKISEQFKGAVKEAVTLNDTMRKLHSAFGMTLSQSSNLESSLVRAFGRIGASSQAAANAMSGMAETPVRRESSLVNYALTATKLASISGQAGQEGEVGKGLAGLVRARGGDVESPSDLRRAAEEVMRTRMASGRSATDSIAALSGMYNSADPTMKGRLSAGGSISLAAGSLAGGKDSTLFMESLMSKNFYERAGVRAQGFEKILGKGGGLDSNAVSSIMGRAKGLGGAGGAQAGLTFMGLNPEEARGLIRLSEAMNDVQRKSKEARGAIIDIDKTFQGSKSFSEKAMSPVNRVKGMFDPLMKGGIEGLGNTMAGAGKSDAGSLAAVAGGGVLAALMAGWGLRGVGKSLGIGGMAKGAAVEGITGRQVQPVYVTNASEIGGGASASALGMIGLPVAGAVAVAASIAQAKKKYSEMASTDEGQKHIALVKANSKFSGESMGDIEKRMGVMGRFAPPKQEFKVTSEDPRLKVAKGANRGTGYMPHK